MSEAEGTPSKEAVLRSLNLPTSGEFPFVPPKNWHPIQPLPRGQRGGYLDRKFREWIKGRSITPGQLPKTHINVDWSGRITHPRPATRARRKQKPRRRG